MQARVARPTSEKSTDRNELRGCLLAARTPNLLVGGIKVPVIWDEPMEVVGRPWFECPICQRRCRHLYLCQLACRRCCRLDYSSRHLHRSVPGFGRILYRRRKIGVGLRPFSPIPPRPRRNTRYWRTVAQIRAIEARLVGHLKTDINEVLERWLRK